MGRQEVIEKKKILGRERIITGEVPRLPNLCLGRLKVLSSLPKQVPTNLPGSQLTPKLSLSPDFIQEIPPVPIGGTGPILISVVA